MPWIEKEGRTVEEARAAAIAAAGLPEDDLEVEVIREGAKGLFGLGGEPALVRVRPRSEAVDVRDAFKDSYGPAAPVGTGPATGPGADTAPFAEEGAPADTTVERQERVAVRADGQPDAEAGEREQAALEVASEMVRGILERMGLKGEIQTRVSGGTAYVEVFGEDMGILIGRGGATLEALQEIVRAGVRRRLQGRQPVVVDVESYWDRRRGARGGRGGGRSGSGGRQGRDRERG